MHLINFGGDGYAPLACGAEIVALAKEAGVQRITLLMGGESGTVERAMRGSDLSWTFIQPVEFMSNFLEWAEAIRTKSIVREPFASRRSALVHEADIAAVAAVALVEEGHGGKTYTITGPEVLTPPELLRTIGEAIGRDLKFEELSEAQARRRWQEAGYPEQVIEFFVMVHGNTPPIGYTVLPTVEEVTGHPARPFARWASEHAEVFC